MKSNTINTAILNNRLGLLETGTFGTKSVVNSILS